MTGGGGIGGTEPGGQGAAACPVAVVVTHRPDLAALRDGLAALVPQVTGLVLVDNGSGAATEAALGTLLQDCAPDLPKKTLFLPENAGLGRAQNAGIALARDLLRADAVLLMDQDSRPAPDMVTRLVVALRNAATGYRLPPGAVGPDYSEPGRGRAALLPPGPEGCVELPALIASGALIPLSTWEIAGGFDETLFVDFVDTEWCFRARAAGFACYAVRGAGMTHGIGAPGPRLPGRRMALHPPDRLYYQLRNLLLLARRAHVPRLWLMRTLPRYLGRSLVLALLVPPRGQRLQRVALGLWHGLRGRSGALGA